MSKSLTPANEIDVAYNAAGGLSVTPIDDWVEDKEVTREILAVHERIEGALSDIKEPRKHWIFEDLYGWYIDIQEILVSRSWTILYRAARLTSN